MRFFATILAPSLVLGALLLGRSRPASADPGDLVFRWSRDATASTCASSGAMTEAIAQRLGASPFAREDRVDGSAQRSLEGLVERRDGSWRVRLALRDAAGKVAWTRELASRDAECSAVTQGAALAVAALLAPDVEAARRASATADTADVDAGDADAGDAEAAAPPVVPTAPRPQGSPAPTAAPASSPETTLEIGTVGAVGVLPSPGLGVTVGATRALAEPLRLELGADWLGEVRTTDDRFAFGLVAARLGLCAPRTFARATLAVCGRAHLGVVHGTAYAVTPSRPGERAWVGLSAGPALRLRLVGPLALLADASLLANVLRYQFVSVVGGNDSAVFEQPIVGARAQLGLGVLFP